MVNNRTSVSVMTFLKIFSFSYVNFKMKVYKDMFHVEFLKLPKQATKNLYFWKQLTFLEYKQENQLIISLKCTEIYSQLHLPGIKV